MKRQYRLSEDAELDVTEIQTYLFEQTGFQSARRVSSELHKAMQFLARLPEAGHAREDLTDRPLKFWTVYTYLIIYDPSSKPLEIIRVLQGKRNIGRLLGGNLSSRQSKSH